MSPSSRILPLLLLASLACYDAPITSTATPGEMNRILTTEAARSLDREGKFVLEVGPRHGEITAEQAKTFALAFWRNFERQILGAIQADRGASIDAQSLTVCPRVFYAASAYTSVSQNTPDKLRKIVGSQWLVGLCAGSVQEVVVAVSADANDVVLGKGGALLNQGNGNFQVMGVPVGVVIPMLPEPAAAFVSEQSKSRISAVPRLTMRPYPAGAMAALWQLDLESPTEFAGATSKAVRQLQTVSTGHLDGWGRPLLASGTPEESLIDAVDIVSPDQTYQYVFTRRSDVPKVFETITKSVK